MAKESNNLQKCDNNTDVAEVWTKIKLSSMNWVSQKAVTERVESPVVM